MPKQKKEETKKENSEKIKVSKETGNNFEERVIKLAKEGLTAEKIGESLRKEGIHPQQHEKISRILKRHNLYISPGVKNAEEKLKRIENHKSKNIQDKRAMRERERVFSLLQKEKSYYEKHRN